MAEQPAAERTQQPTPRKLQKAREKGHLPQSHELMSVATLFVLVAMVTLLGPNLLQWTIIQIKSGLSCENGVFADTKTFLSFINGKVIDLTLAILPILAALFIAAVLAGISMSGFNFAPGALKLNFNKLNPVTGFENLINVRSIVKLLISVLKLFFISLIVWFYLRGKLDVVANLRWAWSAQLITAIARIILGLMIRVCIAILIIAVADIIFQKWKYINDLKMTRQEVKQDHKDTEGSPQVKSRIRRIQFELAMRRMLQEVPKASVVLVNPTHVAVALRYDAKTMDAPIMVAKGADNMAEKIREIARAYGVPVIRRPELARTIYSTVKPGNPIPENLFVAVAEVLAMIYRLRHKKK
jgi:flagellar biosynthetic protein FlhB